MRRTVIGTLVQHLPTLALGVSGLLNVGLVMKLDAVELKSRPGLHVGDTAPAIRLSPGPESPRSVQYAGTRTVLYHFSAECGWCERNWGNIAAVADQAAGRFRVVGVSIAKLPAGFREAKGITFDVLDGLPPEVVSEYRLGATPQTLVMDEAGQVVASWFGAYSGALAADVERELAVRLPGLLPRPARPVPKS